MIRFCPRCGARVAACPDCGTPAAPNDAFCRRCGRALGAMGPPARFANPRGYTPRHLADKILTSRSALEGERKTVPFIGLNEEPGHRGNANRFAFWADTEEEVNRLGAIVRKAGAQNIEGPDYCHEYTPGYYAIFFEDGDGTKWEICCRNTRVR